MKRIIHSLTWLLIFLANETVGQYQINGTSIPDKDVAPVHISMPTLNTGVAIAPSSGGSDEYIAVVYDSDDSTEYRIKWYDKSGTVIDSNFNTASDPDVAYYTNSDLVAVVYNDLSIGFEQIYLDIYEHNGSGSHTKNIFGNPDGLHPNIDINSSGQGLICYEYANEIFLTVPTIDPVSGAVGSAIKAGDGSHPDAVILDDTVSGVLTYIDGGDLVIEEFDYQDLVNGTFTSNNKTVYSGNGEPYAFPRIAGPRNEALIAGLNRFSVVVERDSVRIMAVTSDGNMLLGPYTIDTGLVNCNSYKPVVTFSADKIVYAWTEDYSSCTQGNSLSNTYKKDILFREFDAQNMNILNAGDLYEVNDIQGSFEFGIPALNSLYDGDYPITTSTAAEEAIVYNNEDSVFFKHKTTTFKFKRGNKNEEQVFLEPQKINSNILDFTIVQNPVNEVLKISIRGTINETNSNVKYSVLDIHGKQVKSGYVRMNRSTTDQTKIINLVDLKSGGYFLKFDYSNEFIVKKFILQ